MSMKVITNISIWLIIMLINMYVMKFIAKPLYLEKTAL